MDPKKSHEVDRFTAYVQHAFSTSGIQHVLDIGSGRAHLSRQLALPPNNLQVTCIDNSAHQTSRAERLNGRYQLDPESEQLRHLVMQLDEQNIVAFLQEWPEKAGNGLVVALHACGDLTVDVLRALVKAAAGNARIKGAVIVGCCYNLMTSRSFAVSQIFTPDQMAEILTRPARNLATQAPSQWTTQQQTLSTTKLFYRARLQCEIQAFDPTFDAEAHRVGRIRDSAYTDWPTYRKEALVKFGFNASAVPVLRLEQPEEVLCFRFAMLWTIRAALGPVIESLIVCDRFAFLQEHGADAQLVPLFDQATGSLRNLALSISF